MEDIFLEAQHIIEQGITATLCIVVSTAGSTPRKAGAKMLVFADGSIKGTIGGGSIEWDAVSTAMTLMGGTTPLLKDFDLKDDLGMLCGGSMKVYFEPLNAKPALYIFGGGHVGKALAGFAAGLGFAPCVIDQRPEIFDSWQPEGVRLQVGDYMQIIENLSFNDSSYIVIVTPQHEFDEKVLFACIPKPHAYIGMIGSRRKVAEVRQHALDSGKFTAEQLDSVDMPVGIPFAAETPEEIAVSIVAKLIDVKNTRKKS